MFEKCSIEIIFVNDYPDEKIIIKEKTKFFDYKIVEQEQNMGIHASRVKGIMNSRGIYIIMLDQDDVVMDSWLYSQWNKIVSENASYCVCNGWNGRFRILWDEERRKNINNLEYYLTIGNAIRSPGQVIIKKDYIPQEWKENIQSCNGADDFLLWILILKKGEKFIINDECLYYHTPERNQESIDSLAMLDSLKETEKILRRIGVMRSKEIELFNKQIDNLEYIYYHKSSNAINIHERRYYKFYKMFFVMLDWMNIKNKDIKIEEFFLINHYFNIAIYGMGYIGECLFNELNNSDICIKYGIDRSAIDFQKELPIYKIEDDLEKVDAVVMTVAENNENLIDTVKKKIGCPVVTISDLLVILGTDMGNRQ